MKTLTKTTSIAVMSLILLPACASTSTSASTTASFGQAVKQNMLAHTVQPTAAEKSNTYIPADQDRRRLAIQRYKADEVEEPVDLTTTED